MGTDIDIYAEILTEEGWQPTPKPAVTEWSEGEIVPIPAFEDMGRPRNLISVLAGSGTGMEARMVTSTMPSISEPRGFPEDMNPHYRCLVEECESYGWGASWLWLREILEFDWHGTRVFQRAYVERRYAALFQKDSPYPTQLPEEVKLFHGLFYDPPKGTVKVEWSSSVAEWVGCWEWFISGLKKHGAPDRARFIFWFS